MVEDSRQTANKGRPAVRYRWHDTDISNVSSGLTFLRKELYGSFSEKFMERPETTCLQGINFTVYSLKKSGLCQVYSDFFRERTRFVP